jgi:hypothetical protein
MNTWKWSTGEPYYKSARSRPENKETPNYEKEKEQGQTYDYDYDSQKNAINQSLADDSFFNQDSDLINITNSMFSRNQNSNGTRREDIDSKMADREMLAQRGVNPFLQTSYVNDIVTRDIFLKPINTTQERTKNSETNQNNISEQ